MRNIFRLLITTASLILCGSCNNNETIGLDGYIHHDDFDYSVKGYKTVKQIGEASETKIAKGTYYLINFMVFNQALRVNHKWDNSIAYLVDENGNVYNNDIDAQRILNEKIHFGWNEKYVTPCQSTDSTLLVFDVPKDVEKLYLKVRGQTLMGDLFDGIKFRRAKIKLF